MTAFACGAAGFLHAESPAAVPFRACCAAAMVRVAAAVPVAGRSSSPAGGCPARPGDGMAGRCSAPFVCAAVPADVPVFADDGAGTEALPAVAATGAATAARTAQMAGTLSALVASDVGGRDS